MVVNSRPITYYGTPVLHRRCADVTVFDQALSDLIDVMFASMHEARGVGLAANQIGVDAQIFVYDCPDADDERQVGHVVNPGADRALRHAGRRDRGVPVRAGPARVRVPRDRGDRDRFRSPRHPLTVTGTGYFARCLQHETDHLNGTVYVDLLPAEQRESLLREAGLR